MYHSKIFPIGYSQAGNIEKRATRGGACLKLNYDFRDLMAHGFFNVWTSSQWGNFGVSSAPWTMHGSDIITKRRVNFTRTHRSSSARAITSSLWSQRSRLDAIFDDWPGCSCKVFILLGLSCDYSLICFVKSTFWMSLSVCQLKQVKAVCLKTINEKPTNCCK